jgi:hypothetical protein
MFLINGQQIVTKEGIDMSVLPERNDLKNSITWISEHLEENPDHPLHQLVDKAIFEFNLSPADADILIRFFHERAAK